MPKRPYTLSFLRALDAVAACGDGLANHKKMRIGRRFTSFRLDHPTWQALSEMAAREDRTVRDLCTEIDAKKPRLLNLTVAIRVATLHYHRARRSS